MSRSQTPAALCFILLALMIVPFLVAGNVSSSLRGDVAVIDVAAQVGNHTARHISRDVASSAYAFNASSMALRADSIPSDTSTVEALVKFQPSLKNGQQLRLGTRDLAGNTSWTPLYDSALQGLAESFSQVGRNGSQVLLKTRDPHGFDSRLDASEHVPANQRISDQTKQVKPRSPTPDDIKALPFRTPGVPPSTGQPSNSLPLSLKGDFTAQFYLGAPNKRISLRVIDLNGAKGPDTADVTIRGLDGRSVRTFTIQDDGTTTSSGVRTVREIPISINANPYDWYILEVRRTSSDLVYDDVVLPQPAGFLGSLTLASPAFQSRAQFPLTIRLVTGGGALSSTATAADGVQNVTVRASDGTQYSIPAGPAKAKMAVSIPRGNYEVRITNGSLQLSIPDGFFSPTGASPSLTIPTFDASEGFRLNNSIRGNAVLWTYVTTGGLHLHLEKQDLNQNNGDDNATITISDAAGNYYNTSRLPDDGDLGNASARGPLQTLDVHLAGLPTGSYRIAIAGGGDYRWQQVAVNQTRLVFESLFTVGRHPCCFKGFQLDNALDLYYDSQLDGNLSITPAHKSALQTIDLSEPGPNGSRTSIILNQTNAKVNVPRQRLHPVQLHLPLQDVVLSGPGYFSFTPDSFFFPLRNPLVPYKPDIAYLANNTDYVIVDFGDYQPIYVHDEDGTYYWQHTFTKSDVDLSGPTFQFQLQITNFNKPGYENRTVVLEDVRLVFKGQPFWERHPWLGFLRPLFE